MIDENVTVWNGSVEFRDGTPSHSAIVAAELLLPDALDVGDVDRDGRKNVIDALAILRFLFSDGKQPRLRLADTDLNGRIEVRDAIGILDYLFNHGPHPGSSHS